MTFKHHKIIACGLNVKTEHRVSKDFWPCGTWGREIHRYYKLTEIQDISSRMGPLACHEVRLPVQALTCLWNTPACEHGPSTQVEGPWCEQAVAWFCASSFQDASQNCKSRRRPRTCWKRNFFCNHFGCGSQGKEWVYQRMPTNRCLDEKMGCIQLTFALVGSICSGPASPFFSTFL